MNIDYETFHCGCCHKTKKISLKVEYRGIKPICKYCSEKREKRNKENPLLRCNKKKGKIIEKSNKLSDFDNTALYISVNMLAEQIGKSRTAIILDIKNGTLNHLNYKNKYYIHPDDAEAYIEEKLK